MELDLRYQANLGYEFIDLFNEVSLSCRAEYNEFITKVSKPFKDQIDWWVESPATRNTYASSLFHYYCSANLILKMVENNYFNTTVKEKVIIIDSWALKGIIEDIFQNLNISNVKVLFRPTYTVRIKRFLRKYFYYELFFVKRLLQYIIAKFSIKLNTTRKPSNSIVLIDTFVSKSYLNQDRWYGSFWDHLDDSQKSDVFFVPTIVNTSIKDFLLVHQGLRNSARNNFIKDDFILIDDLFFAYTHKQRVKNLEIKQFFLSDIDVSNLILEDIKYFRDISSLIESLLTYRFMARLADSGIKIRLSIDWFEGHALDKAWNLGLKKFHERTKRIGYRAFFKSYPQYLSTYPIAVERDAGVLPDIFAVQGKESIKDVKEFLPDLNVITIPSFKAEHVWRNDIGQSLSQKKQILVTLPVSIATSVLIIETLINVHLSFNYNESKLIYILKPHPTNTIKDIARRLNKTLPDGFIFTNEKSFPDLLHKSSILITEASSTCLEALACGISVIIIENPHGLTYNPLPKNIPKELYRKTKTLEEVHKAITSFLTESEALRKRKRLLSKKIREGYFEPVTKEAVDNFLSIN